MKKKVLIIVGIILVIISAGLVSYPFVSNYVNSLSLEQDVLGYNTSVNNLESNEYEEMLERAREYNRSLVGSAVISDPFSEANTSDDYYDMLKIEGSDIMANITIPAINVNLPIYHGTSDVVLQKAVGHLSSSSLPVGGDGTHTVLTGHTGLSSQRLFSDVNQLRIGDVFYISCLKEKMAYQVDNIAVVLPTETELLQIDPNQDYVTLVTCTPFGVNTHRLLVRAKRIPLEEAKAVEESVPPVESTWNNEYIKAIIAGAALLVLILLIYIIIRIIARQVSKKKEKTKAADEAENTAISEKNNS